MAQIRARNHNAIAFIDTEDLDLAVLTWSYDRGYFKSGSAGMLHRVIAQRTLGRKLTSDEIVQPIDGDRKNCCRSNLRVLDRSTLLPAKKDRIARLRPDLSFAIQHILDSDTWRVICDGSTHPTEQDAITHFEGMPVRI